MSSSADATEAIDFNEFHQGELPRLLASGNGRLAEAALRRVSLAFRVDGASYTYSRSEDTIEIAPGDETADVVIERSRDNWSGMVRETMTAPGLLYGGKVKCLRGDAIKFVGWEPALRAMYNGRPVWNADKVLLDRNGDPLDAAASFRLADDRDEILCRVNRAAAMPRLATIPHDPRMLGLVELAAETLVPRVRGTSEEEVFIPGLEFVVRPGEPATKMLEIRQDQRRQHLHLVFAPRPQ